MIPLRDDNPAHITPIITVSFIVLCTLVYLYQASLPPQPSELFVYRFGAIPATVFGNAALPSEIHGATPLVALITSMFLHGSWMHLIGNMLYLWIFGDNVEDTMGHVRFITFYVACGILAVFSHAITDPSSTVPMVGASGAISGVLGAYLLLFPRAQVLVLIPLGVYTRTMYVPAAVVLGLWFVMQVLSGGMSVGRAGGGVAFFAHVGGFLAGMALIGLFKRRDVKFFSSQRHPAWEDPR
ncbi:MAG TPA: rhomboid family intramembrane serine protease [Nitrospiraceae bacterium]|nr:rhomboid family intramembrane serine protease [Nitrospiraceae bacterium]